MRLRASLKIRNDHLIKAREDRGWSQGALAKAADVRLPAVAKLEALDYTRPGVEDEALKIACALGIPSDLVLPLEHKQIRFETTHTRVSEIPSSHLIDTVRLSGVALIEDSSMKEDFAEFIQKLPYRRREILKLRYGIDQENGHAYTEAEVAKIFNITRQGVHVIEATAIRDLQRPRTSRILEQYLPSQEWKDLKKEEEQST